MNAKIEAGKYFQVDKWSNLNPDLLFDMKTKDIDAIMHRIIEYDRAAEWYAKHGELPANMGTPGAITEINEDPEAFMDRVKDFKYGLAMQSLNLPEYD